MITPTASLGILGASHSRTLMFIGGLRHNMADMCPAFPVIEREPVLGKSGDTSGPAHPLSAMRLVSPQRRALVLWLYVFVEHFRYGRRLPPACADGRKHTASYVVVGRLIRVVYGVVELEERTV